jgi:hypothetical protein
MDSEFITTSLLGKEAGVLDQDCTSMVGPEGGAVGGSLDSQPAVQAPPPRALASLGRSTDDKAWLSRTSAFLFHKVLGGAWSAFI